MAPSLLAAGRETDPNSWALLADTHLAADGNAKSRGINMRDHFKAVAREVVTLPRRPVGLIIAGDCAYNRGQADDYAMLKALVQPIREQRLPIHLALGNHDNRERFWEAFQDEKRANRPVTDRQAMTWKSDHANWFLLDSLEKTASTPGLIGESQLDWLARSLDQRPKQPALVLVHHNPGITGGNMGLRDTAQLLEVIRPRRQVKAYIFGHTHHWHVEQDSSGIHLVNLPPVAYVFREGDPAGWVHATLAESGMQLELRSIDPTHKAHGQKIRLEWRV